MSFIALIILSGCAYQAGYFDDIEQAKLAKKSAKPGAAVPPVQGPQNVGPATSPSNTAGSQAAKAISPLTN